MPKFEIFIPAADASSPNITLRADADNWMAALKAGMHKVGEQGSAAIQNVLVDVQDDNSVHVTDPRSNRVFRIRELTEAEAAAASLKKHAPPSPAPQASAAAKTQPEMPIPSDSPLNQLPPADAPRLHPSLALAMTTEIAPPSLKQTGVGVGFGPENTPVHRQELTVGTAAPASQPPVAKRTRSEAEHVVELEKPTRPVTGPIGRPRPEAETHKEKLEDLLAEVFERVQDVYDKKSAEEALYFLLDLAMEKIPAEAGSVLIADGATGDLSFKAVRGPKAKELLAAQLVVPAGTGISGFCATEGVSVALSEVQKDPRYYPVVSERLNYETRSVLAAPMMTHGRSYGCLQLINKKGSAQFLAHEMGLAAYIAHQAALYLNNLG